MVLSILSLGRPHSPSVAHIACKTFGCSGTGCMLVQDALQAVLEFENVGKVSAVSLSWGFDEAKTGEVAAQVCIACSMFHSLCSKPISCPLWHVVVGLHV